MVRIVVAVVMSLGALMLGFWGISTQAQQVKPELSSPAANSTYNVSVSVFEGVGNAGAQMLPWMGVAAIVIVSLGLLVYVGVRGGGR